MLRLGIIRGSTDSWAGLYSAELAATVGILEAVDDFHARGCTLGSHGNDQNGDED